jgi:hypothetical protein
MGKPLAHSFYPQEKEESTSRWLSKGSQSIDSATAQGENQIHLGSERSCPASDNERIYYEDNLKSILNVIFY